MSNRNRHRDSRDLEDRVLTQDCYNTHHPPLHVTQKSDIQDTNRSPQMNEKGRSPGPGPPLPQVGRQPQPSVRGSVSTRRNAATSSSIEPQPSHVEGSSASSNDIRLYRDHVASQSVNSDGTLGFTQGSGHRPTSSVDMSGIELPFEITGDEYDLPHSPRTYAYLEAIANRVFDAERNSFRTPVSRLYRSGYSTQALDPRRRLSPSGAHPTSGIQSLGHSAREALHAAINKVKAQSASDHSSNSHLHSDGQQTLPLPGALPSSHRRQVTDNANAVRTSPGLGEDLFAATAGRGMLSEKMSNLGIESPTSTLPVSSAPEKELTLRNIQDHLNGARTEIGELRVVDRGREQPSSTQRLSHPIPQTPGVFVAQNHQLGQSASQFAAANPISMLPHVAIANKYQAQTPPIEPFPSADASWNYSRNIEEVRVLAEAWAGMHMEFYEQETRAYPEVLRALLINACGLELVRPLLESKKTRPYVVVRLLFGYIVDCLASTDIFMGFDHDTDRQVANAQNTLNSPFSSAMVRQAALMDLAAVSTHIRGSMRWQEFLQSLFMKHTFELWSIVEPLLPNAVNRSKANADLSVFVREGVKLAGRMIGDPPGQEWTMIFPRVGALFKGEEMVDRSGLTAGESTASHNRSLRVKLAVTPTIVRRGYIGVSIVAEMVHRANVILMG